MKEETQKKLRELMTKLDAVSTELYYIINHEINLMPDDDKNKATKTDQEKPKTYKWFCSECSKGITDRVKEFSNDKFGQTLCYDCQKEAREKIENAESKEDML